LGAPCGGVPYLAADPDRIRRWRPFLAERPGLQVGVVWQGNPASRADRGRSVPLATLAPALAQPGVRLVSLQRHHGLEQLAGSSAPVLDQPGPEFDAGPDAFLDTAALMQGLDLVVTCDTAVAHLAGALGVPCWVMLKHVPDWRWGTIGAETPWYPTMRLFRQARPGDWDGVARSIGAALRVRLDSEPKQVA
jgi:hypothetical protein